MEEELKKQAVVYVKELFKDCKECKKEDKEIVAKTLFGFIRFISKDKEDE